MKKIIIMMLCAILLVTVMVTPAMAIKANEERAVIAADLTDEQVKKIYSDFGIEQGSVKELTVTNKDERTYLEGKVSEKKIGYVALSCVYIKTLDENEGTNISVMNINWCTEEMYKNALATAGITDANVVISAPKPVSGTAALTGIYKAYEDITGTKLKEDNKNVAVDELVTTGELADIIGKDEAAQIVKELKEILDQTKDMTDEELREQIKQIAASINVELSEEQIAKLIELVRKLEKLDIVGLTNTVNDVNNFFKTVGDAVGNFFKTIVDWFSGLFANK